LITEKRQVPASPGGRSDGFAANRGGRYRISLRRNLQGRKIRSNGLGIRGMSVNNTSGRNAMRYLLALLFPWAVFFTMGKIGQGILCLLLQLTIIGWLPATIWAFISIGGYHADQRTDRIVNAISRNSSAPTARDPRRI
jgi:uncharacterized membrane protein YqaE (UPF0057 family)